MEIPETGFGPIWNERLHRYYVRDFRKSGMKKKDAIEAAHKFISERRELMTYRMNYP